MLEIVTLEDWQQWTSVEAGRRGVAPPRVRVARRLCRSALSHPESPGEERSTFPLIRQQAGSAIPMTPAEHVVFRAIAHWFHSEHSADLALGDRSE